MYPRSPADLTVSNLSQALSLDPSGIASVETEVIGQGVGFLCQLARVKFSYRENARGPKSVVAKFPAAIEQTRGLARQFKFYEREVNFYKHLAKDVSLPSPRCLHASHDLLSDDFLLLLEDLGDRRLGDQLKGCSAEDALAAIRQLASFHAEMVGQSETQDNRLDATGRKRLDQGRTCPLSHRLAAVSSTVWLRPSR